jgi:uncharacterized membrane protein
MSKCTFTRETRTEKFIRTCVALLLVALFVGLLSGSFVGSVAARGGTFVIGSGEETIEKIQLSSSDNVVGNMTVNGG